MSAPSTTPATRADSGLLDRVSLLCIVSGSLDAISFLAFGEAFSSVMTGNVVFLGLAAGNSEGWLALSCGVAILGYVTGVSVGSGLTHRGDGPGDAQWPTAVTRTLVAELAVIVAIGVVWFVIDGDTSREARLGFLAAASLAMGIQGAAVRGVRGSISTTYMTGALTALVQALTTRRGFSASEARALFGLLSLCVGAVIGSVVLDHWRPGALLVPAAALAAVVLFAIRAERADH